MPEELSTTTHPTALAELVALLGIQVVPESLRALNLSTRADAHLAEHNARHPLSPRWTIFALTLRNPNRRTQVGSYAEATGIHHHLGLPGTLPTPYEVVAARAPGAVLFRGGRDAYADGHQYAEGSREFRDEWAKLEDDYRFLERLFPESNRHDHEQLDAILDAYDPANDA